MEKIVEIKDNISIGKNSNQDLIADLFLPPEGDSNGAAIIIVHGGGWREGDKSQLWGYGILLAREGFVCLCTSYRLSEEEKWPAQIQDVKCTVRYIRANADLLNIDPNRIIFAPGLPLEQHLSRHMLADLFLDTFPYGAHTTCGDSIWSGLPVLTLKGNTFASRVSSSLLKAINLEELITNSPDEYKSVAINLAKNPEKLNLIKKRLNINKDNMGPIIIPKKGDYFKIDSNTNWRELLPIMMMEGNKAELRGNEKTFIFTLQDPFELDRRKNHPSVFEPYFGYGNGNLITPWSRQILDNHFQYLVINGIPIADWEGYEIRQNYFND